jgi:predicted O-methyltransferase YrrM
MLTETLNTVCPPQLRVPLARYLAGEISGEITLMQFVLHLRGAGALASTLEKLAATALERAKLTHLMDLAAANTKHLAQVTALVEGGLVDLAAAGSGGVSAICALFDGAVAISPEASVALYALGSSEILDRATGEIMARLAEWALTRSDLTVLDIGCGIGRIESALAPFVGAITAIDISPHMISEARRRCRGLGNIDFQQCGLRDLLSFDDGSFDVILAIDSFPCMFAADPKIPVRHIRDCAQILRPGGTLLILNFFYRGDEADLRDMQQLAAANGFTVQRLGTRDFSLWDGLTFLLRLESHHE